MQIPHLARVIARSLSNNSPAILSGIAVAGVIGTAALAVKATPKAGLSIGYAEITKNHPSAPYWDEETKKEMFASADDYVSLTIVEVVKATWKLYLPAGITGVATIACIIGANQIGTRRNAALLGAYTLVDTAFREYKDEVVKQIGAVKEQKVNDEVIKRHIDENPPKDTQIIITGGGDQLCYESLTGRYFKSDTETIRRCENDINASIFKDLYASLNEFWGLLGLASTTLGDELGFNIEHPVQTVFTSVLAPDGRACLALGYTSLPIKEYTKL
jgi:hypothetical protein